MNYQKLDKRAIAAFYIGKGLLLIFIASLSGIGLLVATHFLSRLWLRASQILAILLLAIFSCLFLIYPPFEYLQWRYLITEERIIIEHGVFFKKTQIIPIIRIQNIELHSGPIKRMLKINDVEIYTASGSFNIPCLNIQESTAVAESLHKKIYERIKIRGDK